MRIKCVSRTVLLSLSVLQTALADVSASYTISTERVMTAMVKKQMPVNGVEITMPGRMRSSVAEPQLEIQQVVRIDGKHSELRVACSIRSECMPFYAIANWSGQLSANEANKAQAALVQDVPVERVLRSGAHATLILESERLHLRLPVICMSGGAAGDTVKVTTIDHHRTFDAVVLNADELRGSL